MHPENRKWHDLHSVSMIAHPHRTPREHAAFIPVAMAPRSSSPLLEAALDRVLFDAPSTESAVPSDIGQSNATVGWPVVGAGSTRRRTKTSCCFPPNILLKVCSTSASVPGRSRYATRTGPGLQMSRAVNGSMSNAAQLKTATAHTVIQHRMRLDHGSRKSNPNRWVSSRIRRTPCRSRTRRARTKGTSGFFTTDVAVTRFSVFRREITTSRCSSPIPDIRRWPDISSATALIKRNRKTRFPSTAIALRASPTPNKARMMRPEHRLATKRSPYQSQGQLQPGRSDPLFVRQ